MPILIVLSAERVFAADTSRVRASAEAVENKQRGFFTVVPFFA
jgi:hypothetical protein